MNYVSVLLPSNNVPVIHRNKSDGNTNPTSLLQVYQQVLLVEYKALRHKHLEGRQGQQEAYIS